MSKFRWVAVVCLLSTGLWAQGAPQVFVSTGTAGKIYSVNTSTSAVTLLVSTPGADYEGMVVAPHNAPADLPPSDPAGTTHYLVYVCDTANNSIVRFDPSAPANLDTIYHGGALQQPQCGRITATGDLIVSSTVAGSGLWKFSGVTNLPLGSGPQTPTALVGVSGSSEGLAQKNIGDILVVDHTNNQVLRSPANQFQTTSTFIGSSLSQPFGIARGSVGDVFVSNDGGTPNVMHFDPQGANPATCQTFGDFDAPKFMQMSLDNTLYIAVSGGIAGSVRAVNAATCNLTGAYALPYPAVGLALAPTMTATQNVSATNGIALNNFGFTAYEANQIVGPCSGTISIGLASPGAIDTLIALSGTQADPAINLALDGFEIVYSTANVNGCLTSNGITSSFLMSDFLPASVTIPGMVVCDDLNQSCLPSNVNLVPTGMWPVGGLLPKDITAGGDKSLRCNIFMVNVRPQSSGPGADTFCGYEPPVHNTFDPGMGTWNLALASSFGDGNPVPVKFKIGAGTGSAACHGGNYIKNAVALLSVAQIADSQGNSTFVPIGVMAKGNSGINSPFFKFDNNQQYIFNWDTGSCVLPSGATQVCPKGTYSVTVDFLNISTAQTIYDRLTTLVILK